MCAASLAGDCESGGHERDTRHGRSARRCSAYARAGPGEAWPRGCFSSSSTARTLLRPGGCLCRRGAVRLRREPFVAALLAVEGSALRAAAASRQGLAASSHVTPGGRGRRPSRRPGPRPGPRPPGIQQGSRARRKRSPQTPGGCPRSGPSGPRWRSSHGREALTTPAPRRLRRIPTCRHRGRRRGTAACPSGTRACRLRRRRSVPRCAAPSCA